MWLLLKDYDRPDSVVRKKYTHKSMLFGPAYVIVVLLGVVVHAFLEMGIEYARNTLVGFILAGCVLLVFIIFTHHAGAQIVDTVRATTELIIGSISVFFACKSLFIRVTKRRGKSYDD